MNGRTWAIDGLNLMIYLTLTMAEARGFSIVADSLPTPCRAAGLMPAHERSGRLRARGSRVPRAAFPQESLTFAGDVRGHVEAAVVVRPAGTRRPWPVLPLMLLLFTKK